MNKKPFKVLVFFLFLGLILGSLVGNFIGSFLPEGAPKKALFNTVTIGVGFDRPEPHQPSAELLRVLDSLDRAVSSLEASASVDTGETAMQTRAGKIKTVRHASTKARRAILAAVSGVSSNAGAYVLDLFVIRLKLGFQITLNIVSILGAWAAVYYFRWFY